MKRETRSLLYFFLGTLLWTWLFYFSIAIFRLEWSSGLGLVLFIAGGPAPSFMGLLLVWKTYTPQQKRDYFARCIDVRRVGWWFLFAPLLFIVLAAVGVVMAGAFKGELPGMEALKTLAANPLMIPLALFLYLWSGPFNEEFGWRGYALDPLLARLGFVRGSAILGFVWGIWHLPWCFMPGQTQQLSTFWLYILSLIGLSLMMSLVYIRTRRSILSALWMHFSSNFFMSQLLSPTSAQYEIWRMILLCVLGCAVVVYVVYKGDALMADFEEGIASTHNSAV
ncbi:MAG: CPBP family intramembrane glutamic endopeptidase [Anaerolineae bacterium]